MKLLVIGLGQCGGRIADRFARLDKRAHVQRGIDVLADAFAVNTDVADLSGLRTIRADHRHRILIGGHRTNGHGVGKVSELAAEIAKEDIDKVIDAIRSADRFYEVDAFMLIASAAGGTGSGAIAVLSQALRERYVGKPVYNIVVLPFSQEETTEARTVYNTAMCLKSAYLVADAVFLVDNQRYVRKDSAAQMNLNTVNGRVVEPFYNLLCAGEETNKKYVGAKTVDAGDIIQTLVGWTVVGEGHARVPRRVPLVGQRGNFRERMAETSNAAHAMDQALAELSVSFDLKDANRAIYLVTAPPKELQMEMVKQLGDKLKAVAPNALLRSGDYPRQKTSFDVAVVLSEISTMRKITNYFTRAIDIIASMKSRQGLGQQYKKLEETFNDIPVLL